METRETQTPFMYIFAEPVTEDEINVIQERNVHNDEEFGRTVLGLKQANSDKEEEDEDEDGDWAELQANVEDAMTMDESLHESSGKEEGQSEENLGDGASGDDKLVDSAHGQAPGPFPSDVVSGARAPESMLTTSLPPKPFENPAPSGREEQLNSTSSENTESDSPPAVESIALDDHVNGQVEEKSREQEAKARSSDPKTEEDPSTTADASFLDAIKPAEGETNQTQNILAMTLAVRNKVNGTETLRPENLGEEDEWSVEYSLEEIEDPKRAWTLYEACRLRRKKRLQSQEEEEKITGFQHMLRGMSQQGADWRRLQDEKDEGRPKVVLGQDTSRSAESTKGSPM